MERLTETWGPDHFVLKGNKTVYNRNPPKKQRVAYALSKLFRYEEAGLDPEKVKLTFNRERVKYVRK